MGMILGVICMLCGMYCALAPPVTPIWIVFGFIEVAVGAAIVAIETGKS